MELLETPACQVSPVQERYEALLSKGTTPVGVSSSKLVLGIHFSPTTAHQLAPEIWFLQEVKTCERSETWGMLAAWGGNICFLLISITLLIHHFKVPCSAYRYSCGDPSSHVVRKKLASSSQEVPGSYLEKCYMKCHRYLWLTYLNRWDFQLGPPLLLHQQLRPHLHLHFLLPLPRILWRQIYRILL